MTTSVQQERRSTRRWITAGVAALVALIMPLAQSPAMAAIELGDSVYIGHKVGYGGTGGFPIWEETPADPANPGEPDVWAYCLENQVSARTDTDGTVGDLATFLGSNYFTDPVAQGKVLWVLGHGYPALGLEEFGVAAGVPGISQNDAFEAMQYAIWRYTDLDFDASWSFETPDSETAYWYLVNGANASAGMTPADFAVTAGITAPSAPQTSGTLVGPFVVSTNQAVVSATVDPSVLLTDAAGDPIDATDVHDGDELYLDLRGSTAAGAATVTVAAAGAGSTGMVVSVPNQDGEVPTSGDHAQSLILVAPSTATTEADATVEWAAVAVPTIGTSLVDAADQDRVLAWDGGPVVDTVSYENLEPGVEYTLTGELMRKSDGSATGITGSATFTPTEASGTVAVNMVVPEGYAGETLVAFEWLFEGTDTSGEPVAEHTDIDDAAQTIVVEEAPVVPVPTIGTSLVDAADRDRVLPWNGGTVVDTVTYEHLVPGVEVTLTGELMRKSDGSATGITGSVTFTPRAASGSVDVTLTVPEGHAGESLVAFEWLYEGSELLGEPIAEHTDINDAAQTVFVEAKPVPATPVKPAAMLSTTGSAGPLGLAALAGAVLVAGAALMVARSRSGAERS